MLTIPKAISQAIGLRDEDAQTVALAVKMRFFKNIVFKNKSAVNGSFGAFIHNLGRIAD